MNITLQWGFIPRMSRNDIREHVVIGGVDSISDGGGGVGVGVGVGVGGGDSGGGGAETKYT